MTRYLELQRGSGEHLLMLINDLLDHSKLEAGMVEIEQQPFSVAELFETSAALLEDTARRKQVRLNIDVPAIIPPLLGDSGRLKQILLNLGGQRAEVHPGWRDHPALPAAGDGRPVQPPALRGGR